MSKIILNNSSSTPDTPSSGKVAIYSGTDSVVRVINSSGSITPITKSILIVNETQVANTAGGTFTSGAWRTRTLNTVVANTISGASLGSNRITLPSGTYSIIAHAPASKCNRHVAVLYNITTSAIQLKGSSAYDDSTNYDQSDSTIIGYFTITSSNVFEIQHQCETTSATYGLGVGQNYTSCIYTQVYVEKIA